MQNDTVFGVLYKLRNRVCLEDAFRTRQEAEDRAIELRRERRQAWVEPLARSSINPRLWTNNGAHLVR